MSEDKKAQKAREIERAWAAHERMVQKHEAKDSQNRGWNDPGVQADAAGTPIRGFWCNRRNAWIAD